MHSFFHENFQFVIKSQCSYLMINKHLILHYVMIMIMMIMNFLSYKMFTIEDIVGLNVNCIILQK